MVFVVNWIDLFEMPIAEFYVQQNISYIWHMGWLNICNASKCVCMSVHGWPIHINLCIAAHYNDSSVSCISLFNELAS